eukprot:g9196.t1
MQRLIRASLEGDLERVTALVDNAVNPRELVNKGDERGFRALHVAVMMGAPECARKLLEAGADPKVSTKDGATPIVMAAQGSGVKGHPELEEGGAAKCIQYLLNAGADQTERDEVVGTVPLHVAVYRGAPGVLEALLGGPGGEAAANTKNSEGATPLHVACRKTAGTAPEALTMLREDCPVKMDVDAADDCGRTPLLGACHYGHADVVKRLLEAGADPSLRDSGGMSPVSVAAWRGKVRCLDALLGAESGVATLEVANNLGATPLILACQQNSQTIAEKLIAAGANLDAKDVTGKTPYLTAKVHNASACLTLLQEKHGRPTSEEDNFDFWRATATAAAAPVNGGAITVETGTGAGCSKASKRPETNPFSPDFVDPVANVPSDP